ncbi:hypothetical protein Taro_045962 [Colocasia esculenta]|uniref:Uncharacterized protein n=1 Tax=Colocasia esculenta TaxID=4460 RepID=A0A843X6Z7_COLES|nr:hypothetical protein [Colocasia esculenta]
MGCVDTLSQTGKTASLGRCRHTVEYYKTSLLGEASSVDTIWSSVDTLSRLVDRVLWELCLVSTLLDLVSTPLDHFFIFCLRAWSIVSTPVWERCFMASNSSTMGAMDAEMMENREEGDTDGMEEGRRWSSCHFQRFLFEFLVEQVDLSLTGVDTIVTDSTFLWTCVDLLDLEIGLKKHKGSKNREENSLCRQKISGRL